MNLGRICSECELTATYVALVGPTWKARTEVYCCAEDAMVLERECAGVMDVEFIDLRDRQRVIDAQHMYRDLR